MRTGASATGRSTTNWLERCLEAAVHAPSAENRQPWQFVVVRDPAVREAISELTRRAWREGGRQYSEGRLAPGLLAAVDDGAEVRNGNGAGHRRGLR